MNLQILSNVLDDYYHQSIQSYHLHRSIAHMSHWPPIVLKFYDSIPLAKIDLLWTLISILEKNCA
jgi:hypothetical protein